MELERKNARMEQEERLSNLSTSVFHNPDIAEEIVKRLDFPDLKTFRQLNSSCQEVSSKNWEKRACVRLQKSGRADMSIAAFYKFVLESFGTAEEDESTSIPFQSFALEAFSDSLSEELKLFASQCSRYIKNLEINILCYDYIGAQELYKTLWILTGNVESLRLKFRGWCDEFLCCAFTNSPTFSNLKRLHLNLSEDSSLHLLTKFPSLKELVVNDNGIWIRLCHDWLPALRFRLTMIKTMDSVLALTSLDIIGTDISEHVEHKLVEANFPLEHLALNIPSGGGLESIVDHYGTNLVTLRLSRDTVNRVPPLQLHPLNIQFKKLVDVELWGNLGNRLDFLKQTPALARLKIYKRGVNDRMYHDASEDEAARLFGDMVLNSKLLLNSRDFIAPSLKVFRTDRKIGLESWKILKEWMPNLQIMEAPISE